MKTRNWKSVGAAPDMDDTTQMVYTYSDINLHYTTTLFATKYNYF